MWLGAGVEEGHCQRESPVLFVTTRGYSPPVLVLMVKEKEGEKARSQVGLEQLN